jgi:hypothetical protein
MYLVNVRAIGFCLAIPLASSLLGCSMHPLPENVSRANTFDIVERIRCEVSDALNSYLEQAHPRDRKHVENIIAASAIGYDFTFEITEWNNRLADDGKGLLAFKRPSFKDPSKGFSLDLTAEAHKIRKNTRKFRIVENLRDLLNAANFKRMPAVAGLDGNSRIVCDEAYQENWVYPITGSTGMGEVVRTYIRLEQLTDFDRSVDKTQPIQTLGAKAVVFSDQLAFTTTVRAGVKPVLELNAVPGTFKLTTASFFGTAEREDMHNVTVALASNLLEVDDHGIIDPSVDGRVKKHGKKKKGTPAVASAAKAKAAREVLVDAELFKDSRQVTALVQKDEPARNRVLIELQRLTDLQDEDNEAPRVLGKRLLDLMRLP